MTLVVVNDENGKLKMGHDTLKFWRFNYFISYADDLTCMLDRTKTLPPPCPLYHTLFFTCQP